jgi:hypothetical protein
VFDISNPESPLLVSSFRDIDLLDAMGLAKHENTIYLTSLTNHKLLLLDASNPGKLQKLSAITIGGEGPTADRVRKVAYADGHVYVSHSSEGTLYVCDVRNPESPEIVGSVATGDGAFAVMIKGDYAFVGGCFQGSSLKVIDITDKNEPKLVKTLFNKEKYGCTCSFQIKGNYLYAVAYSSDSFIVFDITDPANPVEAGFLQTELLDGPGRLVMDGNKAYVINSVNDSFAVIDVTDPKSPRLVHIMTDRRLEKAYGLDVKSGYAYIAGRESRSLSVLKTDDMQPSEYGLVSFLQDSIEINAPEDILIREGIAYIPCRDGGSLTLVDIVDPAKPSIRQVYRDNDITQAMGLDIEGKYLYLTSMSNRKVLILDISNPDHIKKISTIQLGEDGPNSDRLRKVVYRDNHLFVTQGNSGTLFILNIKNPAKPRLISKVQTGDGAFNVYLKGSYAYVGGCGGTSLNVIDIADLRNPKLVKTLKDSDNYSCLCSFSSTDNYLFAISFYSKTFVVFDITDPVDAKGIAIIQDDRLKGANRLFKYEDQVYIATALTDGMVQIDVSNPRSPKIVHMTSSQLLDKAYGVTFHDGLVYVVGRDADSMVILKP